MPLLPNVNSLYLEDTNISDDGLAILLKSVNASVQNFKSLTYIGSGNKLG